MIDVYLGMVALAPRASFAFRMGDQMANVNNTCFKMHYLPKFNRRLNYDNEMTTLSYVSLTEALKRGTDGRFVWKHKLVLLPRFSWPRQGNPSVRLTRRVAG
eukprot:COSAG06_NODE_6317_length_2987_cov_2.306440_1_plen_102_part_00